MDDKVTSQNVLENPQPAKHRRILKTGFRLVLAYSFLMVGLTQASRLSVWTEGSLVYKHTTTSYSPYHGKVSRDFITGDYRVLEANGTLQVVPQEEVKEVDSKNWGVNHRGMLSAILGFSMAMLCFTGNPFRFRFKRSY